MTKKTKTIVTNEEATVTLSQTNRDVLLAILIVSLTINLFVLIGWVTLQVTSAYDAQVASFLFTR